LPIPGLIEPAPTTIATLSFSRIATSFKPVSYRVETLTHENFMHLGLC